MTDLDTSMTSGRVTSRDGAPQHHRRIAAIINLNGL